MLCDRHERAQLTSNLRDLHHRAEYALIRIVLALFRSLPLDFAVGLSARALLIAGPWSQQHRRTLANLAIAFPERSKDERRCIALAINLGNWELAIWPFNACGGNPAGVYRSLPNPYVDRLVREQHTVLYPGGLFGNARADARGKVIKGQPGS